MLLLKYGALGDVLRTTSILPSLHQHYGPAEFGLEWLTSSSATPLLQGNPYVNALHTEPSTLRTSYDWVLNLEEDQTSAALSLELVCEPNDIMGFRLIDGHIGPSVGSERWFAMSLLGGSNRDDLKRTNTKTHPEILCEISRIHTKHATTCKPQLFLSEEDFSAAQLLRIGDIAPDTQLLGVATWGGPVWPKKTLPKAKLIEILRLISSRTNARMWLLSAESERSFSEEVRANTNAIVIASSGVRELAARIAQCDVLLCVDSLPLHIANALDIPTVVLVGPTSASELELYGNGEIITSDLPCLCCYRRQCNLTPDCMESLEARKVAESVINYLLTRRSVLAAGPSTGRHVAISLDNEAERDF